MSIGVHSWLNCRVDDEPLQLPIDGVLDLHTFQPREVKSLVLDYLAECRVQGILRVRIIHGKGIGSPGRQAVLRHLVRGWLMQKNEVLAYCQAPPRDGGDGALIALLRSR